MARQWTVESAVNYIKKVLKGKQQPGLTYCSARDYLTQAGVSISKEEKKQNDSAGASV